MNSLIDVEHALQRLVDVLQFLQLRVMTREHLLQLPALFITLMVAWIAARLLDPWLRRLARNLAVDDFQEQFYLDNGVPLALPALWIFALWLAIATADAYGWPHNLVSVAIQLAAAWLLIRIATGLIPNSAFAKVVAALAWSLAALSVVGLLGPGVRLLQEVSFPLGAGRVSLLTVVEAVVVLAVALWCASLFGRFAERRIQGIPNLSAAAQVLFGKLTRITLTVVAVLFGLAAAGIDLTAFAVFTGAVGVGVGFGLQRTVSNLFAGIVLLLDKSIKPGDILEVGGTFGWVASLGARYVEVETRDGTQFLIPNEDIITQQVFNWTHQNDNVRLKLRARIAYDADVRLALSLLREAAVRQPRVLKSPLPNPLVIDFGENGLELELRFWIADVRNGVHNVCSDVYLEVLDLFRANGIQVPLPQRDVYVQTGGRSVLVPSPLTAEERAAANNDQHLQSFHK